MAAIQSRIKQSELAAASRISKFEPIKGRITLRRSTQQLAEASLRCTCEISGYQCTLSFEGIFYLMWPALA